MLFLVSMLLLDLSLCLVSISSTRAEMRVKQVKCVGCKIWGDRYLLWESWKWTHIFLYLSMCVLYMHTYVIQLLVDFFSRRRIILTYVVNHCQIRNSILPKIFVSLLSSISSSPSLLLLLMLLTYLKSLSCVDSLWPMELYSPWNSSGQNTGGGNHSLLQGIFPTQR